MLGYEVKFLGVFFFFFSISGTSVGYCSRKYNFENDTILKESTLSLFPYQQKRPQWRQSISSDIARDEGEHLVLGAVRRCWNEAERSRDRKLQCVGGTHAAQLGLAGPALASRLEPVSLKSLRKGTDQRQGKGPQYSLHTFWRSSAHVHLCVQTQRNTKSTCCLSYRLLLIAFYVSLLLLQFSVHTIKARLHWQSV